MVYFLNMCNLRSQEDIQVGYLLELFVIMGLDLQPLASSGDKVCIAISKK